MRAEYPHWYVPEKFDGIKMDRIVCESPKSASLHVMNKILLRSCALKTQIKALFEWTPRTVFNKNFYRIFVRPISGDHGRCTVALVSTPMQKLLYRRSCVVSKL